MRCEYATIPDIINHCVRQKCFDIIEKAVSIGIKHFYDFGEITRKGVGLVNKREALSMRRISKSQGWNQKSVLAPFPINHFEPLSVGEVA